MNVISDDERNEEQRGVSERVRWMQNEELQRADGRYLYSLEHGFRMHLLLSSNHDRDIVIVVNDTDSKFEGLNRILYCTSDIQRQELLIQPRCSIA